MFNGNWNSKLDKDGCYFIDRDGKHFRYILNYLRTNELIIPDDPIIRKELFKEVEFYQINSLITYLNPNKKIPENPFPESILLKPNYAQQLGVWLNKDSFWCLLYRGSRDGSNASKFHEKCDNIGETIVIIKTNKGEIFGGYTNESWSTVVHTRNYASTDSFIFSLKNGNRSPIKFNGMSTYITPTEPIIKVPFILLSFGCDIIIAGEYYKAFSTIEFPKCYNDTTGLGYRNFASSALFVVDDIEVFGIDTKK